MYQIDTIGMEFETCSRLPLEFFKDDGIAAYFRSTHDASIETPIIYLKRNLHMIDDGKANPLFKGLERGIAGSELVSTPLTFDEMSKAVSILIKRLSKFGAREEEERAGIHIHCAYPISYKILVDTIKLGLAFESLIFHLGGLGYQFRGLSNNSIFCRPFSLFGPPIVTSRDGNYIQLLEIEEVLKAKDMEMFWKLFGGINLRNPPSRYHPSRYFFINPFSALLHSTLEFRVFNTTLSIDYILACMRFCQEFTLMCVSGKSPFDFVSSVYNPSMSSQELLDNFCSYTKMEPEWRKILFNIINKTPFPEISKKYILTHLRDYQTVEPIWKPKIFSSEEFEPSGFIDVHNLPNTGGNRNSRERDDLQRLELERTMQRIRREQQQRVENSPEFAENVRDDTYDTHATPRRIISPPQWTANPIFTTTSTNINDETSSNTFQWAETVPVNPNNDLLTPSSVETLLNEYGRAIPTIEAEDDVGEIINDIEEEEDDDYEYSDEEDNETNPL